MFVLNLQMLYVTISIFGYAVVALQSYQIPKLEEKLSGTSDAATERALDPMLLGSIETSRKRPATQELSASVKQFKPTTDTADSNTTPQVAEGQIENYKLTSLITEYINMTTEICKTLETCDSEVLIKGCEHLMASDTHQIPLFPREFTDNLRKTCFASIIIQKLASLTNWSDHSILNSVVEVCNVPEAAALLTKFAARVDPSQPLTKFPIPAPSHHMVPYGASTYTVLAVQLNLQLHHSTLQSVLDTRSLIQEKCEITPHCLQLLAVAKTIHTMIYWTIPKHLTSLIASKVQQYQSDLHQNGIQQVAIYPGTALVTGSALTVGPFSFFNKVSVLTAN